MIEKLEELLGRFGPPFLPAGFVRAVRLDDIYGQPALGVHIGDRDATILEDGEIVASGTNMGDAAEWLVLRYTSPVRLTARQDGGG